MIDGLRQFAHRQLPDRRLGPVHTRPDPAVVAIFRDWAQHSSFGRATALGMTRDADVSEIIQAYLEDFAGAPSPAGSRPTP